MIRMDHDDGVHLPTALKDAAERVAREDGTTLNQFVVRAVAERLSTLQTAEFFAARGARADLDAFDRFMSRTDGIPPGPDDLWDADEQALEPEGPASGDRLRIPALPVEPSLDWLASEGDADGRPMYAKTLLDAGARLSRDLRAAALVPTIHPESGSADTPADRTPTVLPARQRVRAALDAVGPSLSGVMIDLYGLGKDFQKIEAERKWPKDSARSSLRDALTELARHYRMSQSDGRALRSEETTSKSDSAAS